MQRSLATTHGTSTRVRQIARRVLGAMGLGFTLAALLTLVADAEAPPVYMDAWGTFGTGVGQFRGPYCIAIGPDDAVYVTDQYNKRVCKFTREGSPITSWSIGGDSYSIGVCVSPNDLVYVTERWSHQIQVYSADGDSLYSFGASELYPEGGRDMTCDSQGNVYVTDAPNHHVAKFSATGTFLGAIGQAVLSAPAGVAVDASGNVFVADEDNALFKFDPTGHLLWKSGSPGAAPGQFNGPGGLGVDPNGAVYVADHANNRVQKFSPAGGLLCTWGTFGTGPGQFNVTLDVAVNRFNEIYVADVGNNRIERFAAGVTSAVPISWGALKARYRGHSEDRAP